MKKQWHRSFIFAIMFSMMFTGLPVASLAEEPMTVIEYHFDEDGNAEGWMQHHNGVESYAVEGGALHLKLNGYDPYWYVSTHLGLAATLDQSVTIRMKADNGTSVAFYFDTDQSPGLSQAKRIVLPITADGEYREYTVSAGSHPDWRGTVQNFRMDLEPSSSYPAEVSIDYVRIGEQVAFSYEFNGSAEGWTSAGGLSELAEGATSVSAVVYDPLEAAMLSPIIGKEADLIGEMKLRTRISDASAKAMRVEFATADRNDFADERQMTIPLEQIGEYQEVIVKLWEHPLWEGDIQQLKISLVDAAEGASWETDYIRFASVKQPHFHWEEDGNTQGWIPIHHLTDFKAENGVLSARVTGSDPHMGVDNLSGIIGERDQEMIVRMSATAGSFVSIFFATESSPGYAELRRFDFPIEADGKIHEYRIPVGDHEDWKGKITNLRLDLEGGNRVDAIIQLDDIQFVPAPAQGELMVKRSAPAVRPGEEAEITMELRNTGGKAFFHPQAELIVSDGLEVIGSDHVREISDLHPGESVTATWTVRGVAESAASVTVRLQSSGFEQSRNALLPVVKPYAGPKGERPAQAAAYVDPVSGDAVIENEHTRITSPKSSFGYGQYLVYSWDEAEGWKLMATVQPFASAVVQHSALHWETVPFYPTEAVVSEGDGSAVLAFSGTAIDASGREWMYSFDFTLEDGAQQAQMFQEVSADSPAELLNMTGPVLTVGEGSFGSTKEEALFPGLEWLVGDEESSSKLDVHTPAYLRIVPHPYKITVPLMAVRQDGHLVSLSWDPHQKWDGVHDLPAAKFASPNWAEGQNNHVMGLSVLSVPEWVKENAELAQTPYPLAAGQTIRLEAEIATAKAESVSKAVRMFVDRHGLPEVPYVRSFEEQVELGLDAYLRTYWDSEAKGWMHVLGWGPSPFPANMVSLKMLAASDPERKAEAEETIAEALHSMEDKRKLGEPDYHIPQSQAAFHVGYMEEALEGWKTKMYNLMASQSESGAWVYADEDRWNPPLGKNGTPLIGQTALNAKLLLKYALATGDQEAMAAGFKGLAAFESMGNVPRGSQPWEVPLRTPDILASGHATGLYVQAYKITGDEQYLEKAAFWAETGMPFVYTWGEDHLPMMEYSTIPIFGASAFFNAWFAVPVQWNGLVYAYELLELAQYDDSGPWKQLADGILASGEIQQSTDLDEPFRGGYPDNWRLITNTRSDTVMLNPEELVKVMYMKRYVEGLGPNPDIQTTVIEGCPRPMRDLFGCKPTRVTTLADVSATGPENTQKLVKFRLTYTEDETTYVLVAGREMPRKVTVNGVAYTQAEDLHSVESGWRYLDDSASLILKIRHSAADDVKIHY